MRSSKPGGVVLPLRTAHKQDSPRVLAVASLFCSVSGGTILIHVFTGIAVGLFSWLFRGIYSNSLIRSTIDRHSGCFQGGAVVNNSEYHFQSSRYYKGQGGMYTSCHCPALPGSPWTPSPGGLGTWGLISDCMVCAGSMCGSVDARHAGQEGSLS